MNNKIEKSKKNIVIPCGNFCGGNCSDCVYWERNNRDSYDRAYCSYYGSYCSPSERQGCFNYEKR